MHVVLAVGPLVLLGLPPPDLTNTAVDASSSPAAAAQVQPAAEDDVPERKSVSFPFNGTNDLVGRCGILTNFRSAGEGCDVAIRVGYRHVYFLDGLGFFNTPQFQRFAVVNGQDVTIDDPRSPTVYYGQLGIGFALWPTRQIGAHFEIAGYMGAIYSRASPQLATEARVDYAAGALASIGGDWRIRSWPWAFGFDYRVQSIPYVGMISNGEEPSSPNVEMKRTPMDVGHFFMLSVTFRREGERND